MTIRSEDVHPYSVNRPADTEAEDRLIQRALSILEARHAPGQSLCSPKETADYLRLKLADLQHEVFGVIYLDNRHRVITHGELFRGTIDGASVYPREVAKESLRFAAAAVILYHNHPSGNPEPSQADRTITQRLRDALALLDIRVLDHLVVGLGEVVSFAEAGLI